MRSITIPRQMGGQDCGLCATAIVTALAFGQNPVTIKFKTSMQSHLVECISAEKLLSFPEQ